MGMITPEHPSKSDIFTEFAARLSADGSETNASTSEELVALGNTLKGAAIRTGAAEILYHEVDASALTAINETSAPQISGDTFASRPALGHVESLNVILGDLPEAERLHAAMLAQNGQSQPPQLP